MARLAFVDVGKTVFPHKKRLNKNEKRWGVMKNEKQKS